ncbi:glycoside hydrolase family 16 protein [Sphingomonas endolithica]|uniref:glycoside hydrolase family 16 protein n=1 Tax=Sphingomonas endolithica TaxID=2972485 RepID=UPI0021AF169E|nr:glycoside hydrolase family 16 protein [Sphingomonas sp. ZFBP2030]
MSKRIYAGLLALATMGNAQQPAKAPTLGATNVAVNAAMAAPTTAPSWADEFDGTAVDQKKWRFDTAFNKTGWFNNEKQYYAKDRPENTRLADGRLVIEARREALSTMPDWGGQGYSSAKLVATKPTRYGFYEIRAKLPCARGAWPAIWMLPQSGKWPEMGEIDIMEMVGHDANVIHATLHTGLFNHVKGTQRGAQRTIPTACTEFHRYQMDWTADSITIGVDDRAYMRVRNDQAGGHGAWPFDKPFNLILNLAIGGDWGGAKGIDDTALPQRIEVDYVRLWDSA